MLHEQLNNAGVPGAFGFSIFLFTLGVKLLVLPLNWKQMEGTVAMQKLQPRTKQLTKWFGENQQALAIETSNLYKNNNVNPLAGCLPSVAQIPIFIGLYRAIIGLSQDKILDESFFWLPSLEEVLAPPPTGDDSAQAAQTQQILKFLPLMIGWFSLSAPAGLGLYWFWNNIITTAQSVAIKTAMGAWPEAVLEKKPAELN
ncbi:60Kd inner membrane protein-domain-containing protein [Pavlovales sp. CCMP2436]|nr:60Kd inner membrane protein-domain-containing protein [Pavlovales sp. CCMP2436]